MKEGDIICFSLIPFFLLIKYYLYDMVSVLHMTLTICFLILFGSLIFFVFNTWLDKKLSEEQIDKITKETFKDISNVTSMYRINNIPDKNFEVDEENRKRNKRLLRDALLAGFIPGFVIIMILYKYDEHFITNIFNNIISIVILYLLELYFSYSIISSFNGDDLQNIRHEIVEKFLHR